MRRRFLIMLLLTIPLSFSVSGDVYLIAEDAPPNAYVHQGQPVGKSVEIVNLILAEIGAPEKKINVHPWARGYWMLQNKNNIALFPTSRTPAREHKFKWVGPIFKNEVNLYKLKTRDDIQVSSYKDLKGLIIGSGIHDQKTEFLLSQGLTVDQVPKEKQNIYKLFAGRIDIVAYQSTRLLYDMESMGFDNGDIELVLKVPEMSKDAYIAFSLDTDDKVIQKFNQGLERIRENGLCEEVIRRWDSLYN